MDRMEMAACGIDCNECGLYNAGHDLKAAESLVGWFRERGWIAADGGAEAVQEAVRSKKTYCDGCWGDSKWCGCGGTDFRVCCKRKEIAHCGECRDFPCDPYKKWVDMFDGNKKVMERLLSLKISR